MIPINLSCADCLFYRQSAIHPDRGACRVNPPIPGQDSSGIFPTIQHSKWCGQYVRGQDGMPFLAIVKRARGWS